MRIIDFFDQGVRYYADNTAFVDRDSSYTYTEADPKIHKIAAAALLELARLKVKLVAEPRL